LGIPGLVDINKGVCIFSGNLGWQKVRIAGDFREEFGVPVFMDNDVRAATLGEQYFGAGKGIANFICITLGTGVGSGIVISEKIYRGPTCSAGEIGHTTIFKDGPYCNCGNRGCLELYASATGIARRAREYIIAGHYTVMTEMVKGDLSKITAETVSIACDMGDNLAALIIEETAEILGIGIANYINILDPEMVIIGGGVSLAGDKLFSPLKKVVSKRTMKNMGEKVNIVQAKLRDEAGMIGAAVLAMEGLGII
jgi:glucokinase